MLSDVPTAMFMLLAGFFIRANTITGWWKWLYWISYMQWAYAAMMINQFKGQAYAELCQGG
jgi:ABC-type multidrug transport system permease subunit